MKHRSSRNDLTIDENIRFRKLESAFLSRCRHFGYREIKTSTIEPLHIFTALSALSDAKLRRMYSFIDWDGWSGERVALKPDSTTCVARFYGDHLYLDEPRQKLCYVENHFEWADTWDDLSERWQFGVENYGAKKAESDIEVIYMAYDILRETGLEEVKLFVSYPAVIKEIINTLSLGDEDKDALATAIGKGNFERVKEILTDVPGGEKLERLISMQGKSANFLKNHKDAFNGDEFGKVRPALDNFILVCRLLDSMECPYVIDFSLLGDMEYYTGVQFQINSSAKMRSTKEILCAGGRYDSLTGDMLKLLHEEDAKNGDALSVPAVGFALYVRNILRVPSFIELTAASMDERQNISIYISNVTKTNVRTAQDLSDKLSVLGFSARITFSPIEQEKYESFGLVIEVDHERFKDGYQVLFSQKIGKPLLMNLFGELKPGRVS